MKIVKRKIIELIAAEYNPRKINKVQEQDLKDSLTRFGLVDPIIININEGRKNIVIGGHQRLRVWSALGNTEIDCNELDLTLDKERELNIRLNKNGGSFDDELVKQYFDYEELTDWGFTPDELFDQEEKTADGLIDDDEIPEAKESRVVLGDIWKLGKHRIMCGDSTSLDDVEKLMNGEKADMIFTDPPYGINEEGDRSKRGGLAKGNNLPSFKDDTIQYAIDAFNQTINKDIKIQVWFGANYYCHSLPQSPNWLVWDKRVEENQRDYNSDCELAWIKSDKKSVRIFRHLWKGMLKDSERGEKRVHATQKPIALVDYCIKEYNYEANLLLDYFLGSGTTLMACEKLNKKCYGMELDQKYCDVIIERWEQFTGLKAEKLNE